MDAITRSMEVEELMGEDHDETGTPAPTGTGWSRRSVFSAFVLGSLGTLALAYKIAVHEPTNSTIVLANDPTKPQMQVLGLDQECTNSTCLCGNSNSAITCGKGSICCQNADGKGICAPGGKHCCHGTHGVIVCASAENCCKNSLGSAFCCAGSLKCGENVCYTDTCFPGKATVQVDGRGRVSMEKLRAGDSVLVERKDTGLAYEPILGFLHSMQQGQLGNSSEFIKVVHANGEFRATANHMLFVAADKDSSVRVDKAVGDLRVGDQVFVGKDASGASAPSKIKSIHREFGDSGMYGPLTAAGTIVVDGVVASIYATPSLRFLFSHGAAHAIFFPLRAYYALGFGSPSDPSSADDMHPYAAFLLKSIQLVKIA
eukprot:TRINITY_DN5387_c0_g1_i2.p1 TRINITY_DN5387_c0_g1~~TRINITY_DN5387_c0_g1_i2.p1  ORF type:complete len:373 (+),score=65.16 TRINITY_DN5387_c0_g1_i2:50-1168(+)